MTDREFEKNAGAALKKIGATNIVVTIDDGLLGARCMMGEREFEMSMHRGQHDDQSKELIIDAIGRLPAQAAYRSPSSA